MKNIGTGSFSPQPLLFRTSHLVPQPQPQTNDDRAGWLAVVSPHCLASSLPGCALPHLPVYTGFAAMHERCTRPAPRALCVGALAAGRNSSRRLPVCLTHTPLLIVSPRLSPFSKLNYRQAAGCAGSAARQASEPGACPVWFAKVLPFGFVFPLPTRAVHVRFGVSGCFLFVHFWCMLSWDGSPCPEG